MKAAFYESFGDARDVLTVGEKPLTAPAEGELQIELRASGVNPSDVKKRAGARGEMSDEYVIPHSDGAGVVSAVGSGVSGDWIGKRVWICEAQHGRPHGTSAAAANLPESMVHPLPDNTSFAEGAAIPIPMMTAHRCLTSAGPVDGQTVLVTGAAGRVGHYAVQMAKQMGASVVATVGSDEEIGAVQSLGAATAVNFRDADYVVQLTELIGPASVDVVVDVEFGENVADYLSLLRDNGVIASYSSSRNPNPTIAFYDLMFRNIFVHPVLVYSMPNEAKYAAKRDINNMLESGAITHRIAHTLPLDRIVEAHELIENGCKGSVIVDI